jgi:hypothetical protein
MQSSTLYPLTAVSPQPTMRCFSSPGSSSPARATVSPGWGIIRRPFRHWKLGWEVRSSVSPPTSSGAVASGTKWITIWPTWRQTLRHTSLFKKHTSFSNWLNNGFVTIIPPTQFKRYIRCPPRNPSGARFRGSRLTWEQKPFTINI